MVIFNQAQAQVNANNILSSLTDVSSTVHRLSLMSGAMITYAQFDVLTDQEKVDIAYGTHPSYTTLGYIDILDIDISMVPVGTGYTITIATTQKDRNLGLPNIGVANWFLLLSTDSSGSNYNSKGLSVVGNTGLLNSGADLELSSVNMGPTVEFATRDINIILHRDY